MLQRLTSTLIEKIRKNQLIKNSSIYLIARLAPQLLEFLLLPVLSKELTPDDYGITGTMTSYVGVFVAVLALGLSSFLVRNYYDKQESLGDKRAAITTIILFQALSLWATVGLLLLFGPSLWPVLTSNQIPFEPYGQLMLFTIFSMVMTGLPAVVYQARQQPVRYALYSLAAPLFTTILSLITVIVFHMGAYGMMLSKAISYTVVSVIGCLVILVEYWPMRFHVQAIRSGLIYGIPLIPFSVSSWILKFSDRLVLERFVSISQIGFYNFGYSLASIFQLIIEAIQAAWTPIYYDLRNNNESRKIVQTFSAYFCLISLISLGGILFAKDIFILLFPVKYQTTYIFTVPVIIGYYFVGINKYASLPLLYNKKTSSVSLATFVAAISNIGINIALVPRYGVMVAAYSTTFCYFLMAALAIGISRKVDPVVYPYMRILAVIIGVLSCFVFFQLPAGQMVNIYIRMLIFVISSLVLGVLFLGQFIPGWFSKIKTMNGS